MTRTIAMHTGHCEICDEPITAGSEIEADDDTAAVHAGCLDRQIDDDQETADEGWWEQ